MRNYTVGTIIRLKHDITICDVAICGNSEPTVFAIGDNCAYDRNKKDNCQDESKRLFHIFIPPE